MPVEVYVAALVVPDEAGGQVDSLYREYLRIHEYALRQRYFVFGESLLGIRRQQAAARLFKAAFSPLFVYKYCTEPFRQQPSKGSSRRPAAYYGYLVIKSALQIKNAPSFCFLGALYNKSRFYTTLRMAAPTYQPLFEEGNRVIHGGGEHTEYHYAGHDQVQLEHLAAVYDQISESCPRDQVFADYDSNPAHAHAYLEGAHDCGHGGGQHYHCEYLQLGRAQRPHEKLLFAGYLVEACQHRHYRHHEGYKQAHYDYALNGKNQNY